MENEPSNSPYLDREPVPERLPYETFDDGLQIRGPDGKSVANFWPATDPITHLYWPPLSYQRELACMWCARLTVAYNQGRADANAKVIRELARATKGA